MGGEEVEVRMAPRVLRLLLHQEHVVLVARQRGSLRVQAEELHLECFVKCLGDGCVDHLGPPAILLAHTLHLALEVT